MVGRPRNEAMTALFVLQSTIAVALHSLGTRLALHWERGCCGMRTGEQGTLTGSVAAYLYVKLLFHEMSCGVVVVWYLHHGLFV